MTIADVAVPMLLRFQLAGSLAILLVLALRPILRRPLGAELAYRLWALPPICAVATLFPSLAEFQDFTVAARMFDAVEWMRAVNKVVPPSIMLELWAIGANAFLIVFVCNEQRFREMVRQRKAGPAVVGVLWPRMVTPADYKQQFTPGERDHIRRHELTHIARNDPHQNLFVAAVRVVFWFNPLVHVAAAAVRLDQELACDAALLDRRPILKRQYAEALLKAHLVRTGSPLACAWAPFARHPLEVRVAMISRPELTGRQYHRRVLAMGALSMVTVLSFWSLLPLLATADSFHWVKPKVVAVMDLTPGSPK